MSYDCIIVGAGPAGIFAALELALKRAGTRVLILEKGRDLDQRERKEVFCGWGGAGAFSDGKLNLSKDVGGVLGEYVEASVLDGLIAYADSIYVKYGAPREVKGGDRDAVARIEEAAARAGLRLISFPIRHVGTDRCVDLLRKMRLELDGKAEIRFGAEAVDILRDGGAVAGVKTADGSVCSAPFVILAPGRAGSPWLKEVSRAHSLSTAVNPVDIGVRVEVPASVLHGVTDVLHEAKLTYNSRTFDDLVRTFCMNPYGVVVRERNSGLCTVNGHSYSVRKSDSTNFAILVSTTFTEPFHEPIAYGEYIARLANLLGDGIIVQRLGDLLHGRRSTEERIGKSTFKPTLKDATPGDLSFVLPYRYISDIIEMLEALDRFAPGINAPSTLLYGVEVKFYSMRLRLTPALETEVSNLFTVGDGAGITRGIMQASVSGIMAAREILRRM